MKLTALRHVRDRIPDTSVGAGGLHFSSTDPVGQRDLSIYYRGVLSGIVLRVGKAGHMGKDLTEARSPYRKLMLDKRYVGPDKHETTSMRGMATESWIG